MLQSFPGLRTYVVAYGDMPSLQQAVARADGRDRYRRAVADFIAGTLPAWDWNLSEGREIDFHAKAQSAQRRTRFPLRSLRLYALKWSMKTRYFISIVLLLALFTQTALGQVSSFRLAQMDGVIQAEIANKKLPGAVVLVGRKGRIFGVRLTARAVEPVREPMTADTIFDAASLTKVVATATSIMILVERGKLRLSDPVSLHIPELKGEEESGSPSNNC